MPSSDSIDSNDWKDLEPILLQSAYTHMSEDLSDITVTVLHCGAHLLLPVDTAGVFFFLPLPPPAFFFFFLQPQHRTKPT